MDLTDIYRAFHSSTPQYTFFLAGHDTFSKIDHILGHKANLSKCKNVEITFCMLLDNIWIKLELNSKRKNRKYSNTWILNNQWVTEKIRGDIKKFLEYNEN
jgi:hypothetical protein